MSKSKQTPDAGNATEISNTFAGSPVTSDISEAKAENKEVDLSKATVTVPSSAIADEQPRPVLSETDLAALEENEKTFAQRAADSGVGLIKVLGTDFRYIGVAPARDKDAQTPDGIPIRASNSTFTPLANVAFDRSILVKDPKSGEFYYPESASYEGAEYKGNPLISRDVNEEYAAARRDAAAFAKFGVI